jgi:hypothetical protein
MPNGSLKNWALETANRVKMIQASWADDSSISRQETVRQELRRALEAFPGSERAARVQALKAHFPAWNDAEAKPARVEIKETPARTLTPREKVEQVAALFSTLTEQERTLFSQRLADAGYKIVVKAPPERVTGVPPMDYLPEPIARKLGEKGPIRVYPAQVFNVFHELLDCVTTLASAAQILLQEMYRRSQTPVAREREEDWKVSQAIGRYLKGEPSGSPEQMRVAVMNIRVRLAAMLRIPGALPAKMCERLELARPANIKRVVQREGGLAVLKDEKVRCWDRYERLWDHLGLGQIQDSRYWDVDLAKDVISIVEGPSTTN